MHAEIPDGALETERIEIRRYIGADGKPGIAYRGDSVNEEGISLYDIIAMLGFAKVCMIADLDIDGDEDGL